MARYADSLLTEGEQVVYRSRQHWLSLIIRGRSAAGLLIVGLIFIGLVVFLRNIFPDNTIQQTLTSGIGLVLLIIGVVVLGFRWWQWSNQDYVITNRRMLKVTGILNKHSADSSLEKINDAILDQPVLGRMLNYGDLTILTAAEESVDKYHMLNNPKEFKKIMLTQKHNLETGFMYPASMPPTPPLRADSTPPTPVAQQVPQAAAPMAAVSTATAVPTDMTPPPPPPPPGLPPMPAAPVIADVAAAGTLPPPSATGGTPASDASLEVTQTLARLADLRDSGAITAEEYESKKQELLGRL